MYKHFMRCNICWYCIRFEEFTSFFLFLKYFDCSLHIRLINIFDFYKWISHKKNPRKSTIIYFRVQYYFLIRMIYNRYIGW